MAGREKIQLAIDPHNRLVYGKTGKKSVLTRGQTILQGKFKVRNNNEIFYETRRSADGQIPQKIKIRGTCRLDKNHDLLIGLDKWGNSIYGNKLLLKTKMLRADGGSLQLETASRDLAGKRVFYHLRFRGHWTVDNRNRLNFNLTGKKYPQNSLLLQGSWDINKKNELLCRYEKTRMITKTKVEKTFRLKGYWEIKNDRRITYVLSKNPLSELDFRVGMAKPLKRGLLYEIAAESSSGTKKITLTGGWKITAQSKVVFEMPYEKGRRRLDFIFEHSGKYRHTLKLKTGEGEKTGINFTLNRGMAKREGEIFARFLKGKKEKALSAGVLFRW